MKLSPMAREEIASFELSGVHLTPEQIVHLNDLAWRVTRGGNSEMIAAPRVAWAGSVPLFEPTIAAEMWVKDYAFFWWHGASATMATAWACANCLTDGFFDGQTDEKTVRRAIEKWQRGLSCTMQQLLVALGYALTGDAEPIEQAETAQGEALDVQGCPYQATINDALAAGLGVSIADLKAQPRRILADILRRWMRNQAAISGGDPKAIDAGASTAAYVAYEKYVETIKAANVKG